MGAHCSRHHSNHDKLQDNVQHLSNTMLKLQMSNLGDETRAALDLRWLLESDPTLQLEYLERLQSGGGTIQHFLLNCICSDSIKPKDRLLIERLGTVMATHLISLETLEFWHVCQSNLDILSGLLSKLSQIQTLKLDYGIQHPLLLGTDAVRRRDGDVHLFDSFALNLAQHTQLQRLELMGFQDLHIRRFFQSTQLPSNSNSLTTISISCDMFLDEFDTEFNDRTKLSTATLQLLFRQPALTQLILNGVSLQAQESARVFCQLLRQSATIQSLSVTSCLLSARFANALVQSMAQAPQLTKIHLTLDSTDHCLPTYLQAFAKHLPAMTLKELHVGTYHENIDDELYHDDVVTFLHGAAQCKELGVLSLPWMDGWTHALSDAVGLVLRQCKCLQKLSISVYGDNLDPDAASILEAAPTSSSIEHVDFTPLYPWSPSMREALERICEKNRECRISAERLRVLLQEPTAETRAAWFGAALTRNVYAEKPHVVFQSLVMAANLLAERPVVAKTTPLRSLSGPCFQPDEETLTTETPMKGAAGKDGKLRQVSSDDTPLQKFMDSFSRFKMQLDGRLAAAAENDTRAAKDSSSYLTASGESPGSETIDKPLQVVEDSLQLSVTEGLFMSESSASEAEELVD